MKQKANARQKREEQALRRREAFSPKKEKVPALPPTKAPAPRPAPRKAEILPDRSPEEETREFLEYLERHEVPTTKEEPLQPSRRKSGAGSGIPQLNLEDGMPIVSEALKRLELGLQTMRHSRVRVVKLIHGYGSTGRGGEIRAGVRKELAVMKRRRQIREFIPGEDFGPTDPASRALVEQDNTVNRDRDYGRINHGITVVVL